MQKSSRFSLLLLSEGILMLPTIPGPLHLTKIKYTSLLLGPARIWSQTGSVLSAGLCALEIESDLTHWWWVTPGGAVAHSSGDSGRLSAHLSLRNKLSCPRHHHHLHHSHVSLNLVRFPNWVYNTLEQANRHPFATLFLGNTVETLPEAQRTQKLTPWLGIKFRNNMAPLV